MRCPPDPQPIKKENGEAKAEDQNMEDVQDSAKLESLPRRVDGARMETSDRIELIESIKRGESPTWVPGRTLEDYFTNHSDPPGLRISKPDRRNSPSPLLPAAEVKETSSTPIRELDQPLDIPSEIQRPRSALHSGDFREGSPHDDDRDEKIEIPQNAVSQSFSGTFASSPTTPWFSPYRDQHFNQLNGEFRYQIPREDTQPIRSRAPSLNSSLPSRFRFIRQPPTSPLVHQANNTDLDFSSTSDIMDLSSSPDKANRRRTLPPDTFRSLQSTPEPSLSLTREPPRRQEGSYQAHQPRRSLHSLSGFQSTFTQTPRVRSRTPSYSSDTSPLQHAPMVGSYEESILRGRMSTTPSKPLDFMAQIGVLGRGNCRASLRCPPHISVPFPAVFYSYPTTENQRSPVSDDSPSPYVGMIDLEKHARPERESRARHASNSRERIGSHFGTSNGLHVDKIRTREKRRRRAEASKAPSGGSYRIPQKGQLQIIIKNPNKTAVKLFLVPYDLEGMESGTKTFIRQRSYSAGPIIETPIDGTGPETLQNPTDKPVLRYLIHLNICSPASGRFYLYQGIRVVFANRVPDDKEKLRNEIQLPEPLYSPYKATKEVPFGAAGAKLAQEMAFRRRSSGVGIGVGYDAMDTVLSERMPNSPQYSLPPVPTAPIPFHMSPPSRRNTPPSARHHEMDITSPPQYVASFQIADPSPSPGQIELPKTLAASGLSSSQLSSSHGGDPYNKLSKGDAGYGGSAFEFANTSDSRESLLAMRLKALDEKKFEDGTRE